MMVLRDEVVVLRCRVTLAEPGLGRPGNPGLPRSGCCRQQPDQRLVTSGTLLAWHRRLVARSRIIRTGQGGHGTTREIQDLVLRQKLTWILRDA